MNLFKRKTSQENVQETDNLTIENKSIENKSGKKKSNKKYIVLGLVFIAVSGFIIYKSIISNHRVILSKSALKFNPSAGKTINSIPFNKAASPDKIVKPVTPDSFNTLNQKTKTGKSRMTIKKHFSKAKLATGSYSSLIYALKKQIEITKLKNELVLEKKNKGIQAMPIAPIMPNISQMSPQYINSRGLKINNLSKYFKDYKKNTIKLDGVSNAAVDVTIGKSNFVVQAGSEFDGYKVLNIGNSSITVAKDGKIKKLYIH
ncbi:MAG: hypothetical protein ACYDEG_02395 [bacterium]